MEMNYSDGEKTRVITLSGRLDGQAPLELRKNFSAWLTQKSQIIIDCTDLEYIDSNGLGSLIFGLRTAINNNGDIRLANVQANVRMMLELTRTDQVFKIFDTVEKALESFQSETFE